MCSNAQTRCEQEHMLVVMQNQLRTRARLGLSTLVIAATVLGASAMAQSQRNGSVLTVYANSNFGGQRASFSDDMPTLVPSGLNDKVSSIQVPAGETWEVCEDADYGGKCQVLSSNSTDLNSMGWNDQISSIRRTDNGRFRNGGFRGRRSGSPDNDNGDGVVTVYSNINFDGERASFRDDAPTLVPSGMNDKVSSIQIPAGETWEVCQDVDYGNQCQVLSNSVPDLRSMGWTDRISSLRRTDNRRFGNGGYRDRRSGGGNSSEVPPSLLFFNRTGFQGASSPVNSGASRLGFSAKKGSVQLRGGGAWELCDQARRCATIDQDVPDLSRLRLKGRITSARVVDASQDRRNRGGERIR
jgi:hypothetical protein